MELTAAPYDKIAPFYDYIMDHVNYKIWARYIKSLLFYYNKQAKTIIDLSCGTGSLLKYLDSKKWRLYGSDLSAAMLEEAKKKKEIMHIPLWCSDINRLSIKENKFNAALILYDSINYLIEDEQINNFFKEAAAILNDNGLLIFDVVTPYTCKKEFVNYHESKSWGKDSYKRHGWFLYKDNMQYNEFIITVNGKKYKELHQQKIRPEAEWKELINKSPFEMLRALNNFSFRNAHKTSERIHFVCRKMEEPA
ncbi:MAG: class I SAM-dependent methyltransferase [Calditrichales bacterium]|nr:class I SAM-dependent methyltransferase [Calditrichales bacterium]